MFFYLWISWAPKSLSWRAMAKLFKPCPSGTRQISSEGLRHVRDRDRTLRLSRTSPYLGSRTGLRRFDARTGREPGMILQDVKNCLILKFISFKRVSRMTVKPTFFQA